LSRRVLAAVAECWAVTVVLFRAIAVAAYPAGVVASCQAAVVSPAVAAAAGQVAMAGSFRATAVPVSRASLAMLAIQVAVAAAQAVVAPGKCWKPKRLVLKSKTKFS